MVYDALGREAAVLARGPHAEGVYTTTLDTASLAPGLYLVRASIGGAVSARRFTVVR